MSIQCNCLEKAAARAGVNEVPMDVSYSERPRPQNIPLPVLPDTRPYYSLPGHEPTLISPTLRPTAKVIKKLTSTNSPRYDSSLCTSALQQSVRTKTHVDSVAGHAPRNSSAVVHSSAKDGLHVQSSPSHVPRNNIIVVPSPIRDGKHVCSSRLSPVSRNRTNVVSVPVRDGNRVRNSLGHVSTPQTPTILPQSVKAARRSVGQQVSWFSALGSSPMNNTVRSSESKPASQVVLRTNRSDTGTVRAPNLEDWRARQTAISRHVKDKSTLPTPTASRIQTQSSQRVKNSRAMGLSGLAHLAVSEGSRQSLAIFTSGPQCANSLGLFGQGTSLVRYLVAQMRQTVMSTALTFAGACRSSPRVITSWFEDLTYKGLCLGGRNLMSAKKGLQLHGMHAFWSA
jgi:hypothetical protein